MWQVEVKNKFDPENETMATITIKHPVTLGMLIRFECGDDAVLGGVVQFLVDQTSKEFERYIVWIQIASVKKLNEHDHDPIDAI